MIDRVGICFKCKEKKPIINHHLNYNLESTNNVVPCCRSCHKKIHVSARRTGKCVLPPVEVARLSRKLNGLRHNLVAYVTHEEYQIISDKAKPRKVSPSTVGAEWLKERCNIERGKVQA